jgi:hypothetical protein
MSRDELITLVGAQAGRLAAQDVRIATMATQMAELLEANEALVGRLAKLEHLLSRNSKNSSSPPSKDDDPGKAPPEVVSKRGGDHPKRKRGKQPGPRERICPGERFPMRTRISSPRAAAAAEATWRARPI